jgi:hypothetical protein
MKLRTSPRSAVLVAVAFATSCAGPRAEGPRPEADPVRRHALDTAVATAARANAQPGDATLQRAAFDAAVVVYDNPSHGVESFEQQAWPQIKPSVKRVLEAAEDCPTKLAALRMYKGALDFDDALVAYLSPHVRDCLTKDQIGDIVTGMGHHAELCPDALALAGALWRLSPPGTSPAGGDFAAAALGSEQIGVLDMVFDCTKHAPPEAATSFADPKDVAEYLRYKQASHDRMMRNDAQRHEADSCNSTCMATYGEPDGTCRVECRRLGGDTSCFRHCADDGAACFAHCEP